MPISTIQYVHTYADRTRIVPFEGLIQNANAIYLCERYLLTAGA